MSLDNWLRERQPAWKRLETIVEGLCRRGPRRTPPQDVRELTELYPAACADLARLRALTADPALLEPLNRLITRAHGQVYRGAPAGRGGWPISSWSNTPASSAKRGNSPWPVC